MGEGDDGGEVREAAAAAGSEEGGRGGGGERLEGHVVDEDGVRRSPPMTGEGRRVRESVATPGGCSEGAGGATEEGTDGEHEGVEGEAGWPAGGGSVGESSNCLDWVNDRLLAAPASSPPSPPLAPPAPTPPAMAVAVAMRIRAF